MSAYTHKHTHYYQYYLLLEHKSENITYLKSNKMSFQNIEIVFLICWIKILSKLQYKFSISLLHEKMKMGNLAGSKMQTAIQYPFLWGRHSSISWKASLRSFIFCCSSSACACCSGVRLLEHLCTRVDTSLSFVKQLFNKPSPTHLWQLGPEESLSYHTDMEPDTSQFKCQCSNHSDVHFPIHNMYACRWDSL